MKDKKNTLFGISINLDIYESKIVVMKGDRLKASKLAGFSDPRKHDKSTSGWSYYNGGINFIWLADNNKKMIVHELMHAIMNITFDRGIIIDNSKEYQESFCYLCGYVIGSFFETKNKNWIEYDFYKKNWKN